MNAQAAFIWCSFLLFQQRLSLQPIYNLTAIFATEERWDENDERAAATMGQEKTVRQTAREAH
ncbi:hypothetical protein [Domibacillus iocasae]|uniref:hypothetical protein n=1 Tax=Domibacillus iocasae TaxID=1714016 RepID=UPI0014726788|nr:hypothetical protein [Domibacillus iocasae]